MNKTLSKLITVIKLFLSPSVFCMCTRSRTPSLPSSTVCPITFPFTFSFVRCCWWFTFSAVSVCNTLAPYCWMSGWLDDRAHGSALDGDDGERWRYGHGESGKYAKEKVEVIYLTCVLKKQPIASGAAAPRPKHCAAMNACTHTHSNLILR